MKTGIARLLVFALAAGSVGVLVAGGFTLVGAARTPVLGSYSTTLQGRTPAQLANIQKAARLLDGCSILPGRELSVARALGPTTADRGWKEARAYIGDAVEDAVAGGICQVSSTLYNAALLADMRIMERHAHSRPIVSVPCGRDATVAWGVADLRFRNPRPQAVTVHARADSERLVVSIVGAGDIPHIRLETREARIGANLVASLWRISQGRRIRLSSDSYRIADGAAFAGRERQALTSPPQ